MGGEIKQESEKILSRPIYFRSKNMLCIVICWDLVSSSSPEVNLSNLWSTTSQTIRNYSAITFSILGELFIYVPSASDSVHTTDAEIIFSKFDFQWKLNFLFQRCIGRNAFPLSTFKYKHN